MSKMTEQERERLLTLPTDQFKAELEQRWYNDRVADLRRFVDQLEKANCIDTTDLKDDVEAVIKEHVEWVRNTL